MNPFDQRKQIVHGSQYNAGRDINITFGASAQDPLADVDSATLDAIEAGLAARVEADIAKIRADWRSGDLDGAWDQLQRLQGDPRRFKLLPESYRARLLHMQAGLLYDRTGDRSGALELVDDAARVDPSIDQRRIRAQIAYAADRSIAGAAAAAAALDGVSDVDDVLARIAFLLEARKVTEADQELDGLAERAREHAERLRLRAHVHLARGQVADAEKAIDAAVALQPDWLANRHTQAVIWYASTLSPALQRRPISLEPIDPTLVRSDDLSLANLRNAAAFFKAEVSSPHGTHGHDAESWLLVCLGHDPGRQKEAASLCAAMLAKDPGNALAVLWVAERSYPVQLGASIQALQRRLRDEGPALDAIVALFVALVAVNKPRAASRLASQFSSTFSGPEGDLLESLRIQAMAQGSVSKSALRGLRRLAKRTPSPYLKSMALEAVANLDKNPHPFLTHLDTRYQQTRDPLDALAYCRALARFKARDVDVQVASELADGCGTSGAVRLSSHLLFEAGFYATCKVLLETRATWFPGGSLPTDLCRQHIRCLVLMGDLHGATDAALALTSVDKDTISLLVLAHCRVMQGDIPRLADVARELVNRSDLSAVDAIELARHLRRQDDRLAKDLWRKGMQGGLPKTHAAVALDVGMRLGLDAETGPLMAQISELAAQGQGGVEQIRIEQLAEVAQRFQHDRADIEDKYRHGEIPVHLLPRNGALAERYHVPDTRLPGQAMTEAAIQFARHGGYPMPLLADRWIGGGRVFADVTAVLLAADLGLLDAVESAFDCLYIAPTLPLLLQDLVEQSTHHQVSQIESLRQILRLTHMSPGPGRTLLAVIPTVDVASTIDPVLRERVGPIWSAAYATARHQRCYLLDTQPRDWQATAGLRDLVEHRTLAPVKLVRALEEARLLTGDQARVALAQLGADESIATSERPPRDARVFCPGPMAQLLAGLGLLQPACTYYRMHVAQDTVDACQRALLLDDEAQRTATWLEDLRARIAEGIGTGRYKPIVQGERPLHTGGDNSLLVTSLESLLSVPGAPGDALWVDDRMLSGYATTGSMPIVGICEMLVALVGLEALSIDEYYRTLHRLRERNVRFIPFSADELAYWLVRSKDPDGQFVESTELAVLRRYAAACRLDCALLQPGLLPDGSPNSKGEDAFLLGLEHAVDMALIRVWADDDHAGAAARAAWLFTSLFLESPDVAGQATGTAQSHVAIAMRWADLLLGAAAPGSAAQDLQPSIDAYRLWFAARWVRRLDADPILLDLLSKIVVRALLAAWRDVHERANAQARFAEILNRLPEPLGTLVRQDADLIKATGLGGYYVGEKRLDIRELGQALSRAVNGQLATVVTVDDHMTFVAQATADDAGDTVVVLRHADSGEEHRFAGPDVEMFVDGADAWRALLQRKRHWFDCSPADHARVVDELMSIESLDRRRERVWSWLRTSLPMHYERIRETLLEHRWQTTGDLLPQDASALFRHLRLSESESGPFQEALARAATQLVQEEGLLAAITRVRGLPVPLPEPLVAACKSLPEDERRDLFDELRQGHPSPLAYAHYVALVSQCEGGDSAEFAHCVTELGVEEGVWQTELFLRLVQWLDDGVTSLFGIERWPDWLCLVLAYFHADRLWSLWFGADLAAEELRARVRPRASFLRRHIQDPRRAVALDADVAWPGRLSPAGFRLSLLNYALEGRAIEVVDRGALSDRERSQLWQDVNGDTNRLGSFLGTQRLCYWLGLPGAQDDFDLHGEVALLTQDAIERLASDPKAWHDLQFLTEGRRVDADTASAFWTVARATDFAEMWRQHPRTAAVALLVTARRTAAATEFDAVEFMEAQLLACARLISEGKPVAEPEDVGQSQDAGSVWEQAPFVLLKAALYLGKAAAGGVDEASGSFANLTTALVRVYPALAAVYREFVFDSCQDMSAAAAQRLAPLLNYLRCQE